MTEDSAPAHTLTVAEAFSRHDFTTAIEHMAEDVRWVVPGQASMDGRAAVVAACEQATADMSSLTTEFSRFVSVGGDRVAAVDVVATYTPADGEPSTVASADIYEFDGDGRLVTITSYAVEVPAPG